MIENSLVPKPPQMLSTAVGLGYSPGLREWGLGMRAGLRPGARGGPLPLSAAQKSQCSLIPIQGF